MKALTVWTLTQWGLIVSTKDINLFDPVSVLKETRYLTDRKIISQSLNTYKNGDQAPVIRTGEWIITLLIASVPIVNIVMFFVWAFSSGINPTKANWAKAAIIWTAILKVIYLVFFMIFGAAVWLSDLD